MQQRAMTGELPEHPRYHVVREIGRGASGVVYEAVDGERGRVVALKTLGRGRALYDLKNEFHAAADLAHPNLVALYDLVLDGARPFFTMEYVPGVEWRRFARPAGAPDWERIRDTVGQVLDGLSALHAAGWVHRDLKPLNVLVTAAGHAKIVDFGAALAVAADPIAAARRGTWLYMAPEQIEGVAIGPAADLYALGAILYELSTGEPPFAGPVDEIRRAHRYRAPAPPSSRATVPPSIEAFCMRLLEKDPAARFASAVEARRAFDSACGARRPSRAQSTPPPPSTNALRGRERETARLRSLVVETARGGSGFALASGPSGIGKTALVEAALAEAERAGWLVLRGSCREHEAVAHNAFDAIVDGAAALLAQAANSPNGAVELALHRSDLAIVARLFPVIGALPSLANLTPPPSLNTADEERERAYDVVRRAVERVARARPIALLLDDLHWADEDSLALLDHLIRGVPRLLILATAWEPDGGSPLGAFLQRHASRPSLARLPLAPLDGADAARLVDETAASPLSPSARAAIEREAEGNPFLLVELARLGESDATVASLVRRRLAALSAEEVEAIELAAVAAGLVEWRVLLRALGHPALLDGAALRRLCALKILRTAGSERVDFYHHRIREAVRAELSPDRARRCHLALADALAVERPDDHGAIFAELRLAGENARAAEYAERAGAAAMAQLAHGRAVALLRAAVEHGPPRDRPRVEARLAEALEGCGRFAEAARHFRAAIPHFAGIPRAHLEIELANCLLHVGAVEESGGLIERCLRAFGHRARRSALLKTLTIIYLTIRVALARKWGPRAPRPVEDERRVVQLKTYALSILHHQLTGMSLDQVEHTLRYVLLGRRSPAPEVRLEAEAMQLVMLIPFAHRGGRWRRRADDCFARMEALAPHVGSERARSWTSLLRALHAVVAGRPDVALAHFEATRNFEIARGGLIALQRRNALFLAGELDRYIDEVVAEARARCDGRTALATARWAYVLKMRGEDKAAKRLGAAAAGLALEEVPWTHRSLLLYQLVELDLLDGDTRAAAFRASQMVSRIRPLAISPTTGAFESLDAVVRAFVAEALRLKSEGDSAAASRLLSRARRVFKRAPLVCPPLFLSRVEHARAILSLALGRFSDGKTRLERAAELADRIRVPASQLRILDDLIQLRARLGEPFDRLESIAKSLAAKHGFARRAAPAPWLSLP